MSGPAPYAGTLTAWSVECWVTPITLGALDCIWCFGSNPVTVGESPTLYIRSTGQITATMHGAEDLTTAGGLVSSGVSAHIAVTVSATYVMRIYVNGVLVATNAMAIRNPGNDRTQLGQRLGNLFGSNVIITSFRVWEDERTITEVQDNMYRPLFGSTAGGLISEHPMTPGTGMKSWDTTGRGKWMQFVSGGGQPHWTRAYYGIGPGGPS